MNDEKNKKPSDNQHQPKDPQAVRAQQFGDPNQRRNRQEDPETDESRELSSKEGGESHAGGQAAETRDDRAQGPAGDGGERGRGRAVSPNAVDHPSALHRGARSKSPSRPRAAAFHRTHDAPGPPNVRRTKSRIDIVAGNDGTATPRPSNTTSSPRRASAREPGHPYTATRGPSLLARRDAPRGRALAGVRSRWSAAVGSRGATAPRDRARWSARRSCWSATPSPRRNTSTRPRALAAGRAAMADQLAAHAMRQFTQPQ